MSRSDEWVLIAAGVQVVQCALLVSVLNVMRKAIAAAGELLVELEGDELEHSVRKGPVQ